MSLAVWLDSYEHWIISICIVLSAISRAYPKKVIKQDPTDKWSHILDANIWRVKKKIPTTTGRFYPPDDFSYPYGIAYFLKLSLNNINKFVWLNIVVNIAEVFSIFLLCYFYVNQYTAILYLMLASIMPSILSPWYGLYGVNARNIGAILCTMYAISLFIGEHYSQSLLFIPLQITVILISIYFSQFAVQSIIFTSTFTAFWFTSFTPLLPIFLTIVLVKSLSIKSIEGIVRGHYQHVKFYFKFLQYHATATIHRNKSLHQFFYELFRQTDLKKFIISFPFIRLIIFYPVIPIFIGVISTYGQVGLLYEYALGLVLMNILICIIIPLKGLRFLGEADRYFMFGSNHIILLSISEVLYFSENISVVIILMAFFLVWYLLLLRVRSEYNIDSEFEKDERVVLTFLKGMSSGDGNVLCVPTNISDKLAVNLENKFVGIHTNVNPNENYWQYYYDLYSRNLYPYPDLDNATLLKNLNIDLVIISKKFISTSYLKSNGYPKVMNLDPEGYSKILENESYIVLQRTVF